MHFIDIIFTDIILLLFIIYFIIVYYYYLLYIITDIPSLISITDQHFYVLCRSKLKVIKNINTIIQFAILKKKNIYM